MCYGPVHFRLVWEVGAYDSTRMAKVLTSSYSRAQQAKSFEGQQQLRADKLEAL